MSGPGLTVIYFFPLLLLAAASSGRSEVGPRLNLLESLFRRIRNPAIYDGQNANTGLSTDDAWPGRWFPEKVTHKPKLVNSEIQMLGMVNSVCDDGKTNLTVDWPNTFYNYTCPTPKHRFEPNPNLPALLLKDTVPPAYKARHACMNEEITYPVAITTYGTHRPAWPQYGEYKFVPRQRWIHNLEHGAIVLLYHPCSHPILVHKLRKILTSCLYRHIITPYTLLPPERPLALFAWGWALLMSDVDTGTVRNFITRHALNGPEQLSKNGQYDHLLIKPAKIVSDQEDSIVCPDPR